MIVFHKILFLLLKTNELCFQAVLLLEANEWDKARKRYCIVSTLKVDFLYWTAKVDKTEKFKAATFGYSLRCI